jgi:type I restriction enzyme R subunit
MSRIKEHTLEMAIMELYEKQGYSYVNGETRRINVIYGI